MSPADPDPVEAPKRTVSFNEAPRPDAEDQGKAGNKASKGKGKATRRAKPPGLTLQKETQAHSTSPGGSAGNTPYVGEPDPAFVRQMLGTPREGTIPEDESFGGSSGPSPGAAERARTTQQGRKRVHLQRLGKKLRKCTKPYLQKLRDMSRMCMCGK